MSPKHYIRAAAAINELFHALSPRTEPVYRLADEMASMFKADNSNFNRQRFMNACFKPL